MQLDVLFARQGDNCIKNCSQPPPCSCKQNQECIVINRDCYNCSQTQCVPSKGSSSSSSGGASKGALAGGIVGALLFLALAVGLFLWYRRRARLRNLNGDHRDVKDTPAPAETVLNRPDPIEKPIPAYPDHTARATGLEPVYENDHTDIPASEAQHYVYNQHTANPFDDNNSIQTAGSEGTNVIPIALVPAESHRASLRSDTNTDLSAGSGGSNGPVRPPRSPDLNLNLDHVNVSKDNLRPGNAYAQSTRSGYSDVSSHRHSYMSNMTSASEMLNEAPMIMTPTKSRQVVGLVKAEVISAGSLHGNPSNDSLRPPPFARPPVTSPLAATSFGPNDVVPEVDESQEANPFDDKHSSTHANYAVSPPPTASTFRRASAQTRQSGASGWAGNVPNIPWTQGAQDDGMSRPSSMATQAGSVIDITSATRVNVGLTTPGTASTAKPYRTTMGRLISPSSAGGTVGTLEEQQAWALAHAHAQAQAQGLDKPRPISNASAISTTADSILESFPFVPPSPISNRPIRSPPVSPLAQQSFTAGSSSPHQHTVVVAPPSPLTGNSFSQNSYRRAAGTAGDNDDALRSPPNRRTLGLSTGSQLSTASSGLGSFPFQIDSGTAQSEAPPGYHGRQRASLDTLALTADLSSYPLGFDRDSTLAPPKKARR